MGNSSRKAAQQSVRQRLRLLLFHCVCESVREELGVLGQQENWEVSRGVG